MFRELISFVNTDNNLRLAYRNIKTNKGSKTNGLSGKNMSFIANMKLMVYLKFIKECIDNYKPSIIRRAGIPKANGNIYFLNLNVLSAKNK